MAITCTARGTAYVATVSTTGTFSPASNFAAGSLAVCFLALNNSEALGEAYATLTLTDSNGNTWTRREMPLYDPAGVNAGITGAIFTSPMDGGTLTTGSVLTVTTSTATARRIAILWEVVPTAGSFIGYVNSGVGTGSATTTPTVTTGSIASGNIVIAGVFVENNTVITADSDTTNGNWSTQQTQGGDTNTNTGIAAASQYKVVTGTATQSYDPVLTDSADCIATWIQLNETSGSIAGTDSLSFTPSGAMSAQASLAGTDSSVFTSSGASSATASVAGADAFTFTSAAALSETDRPVGWASINGWWFGWTLSTPPASSGSIAATDSFAFTVTASQGAVASIAATDAFAFTVTAAQGATAGLAAADSFAFTSEAALGASASISATDSFAFTATSLIGEVGGGSIAASSVVTFSSAAVMSAVAELSATDSFAFTVSGATLATAGIEAVASAVFSATIGMGASASISASSFLVFVVTAGITKVGGNASSATCGFTFGTQETVFVFHSSETVLTFEDC